MCLLPAFLIFGEKPFRETICALLVAAIYFALHTLMFRKGLILEFALPALGLFAGSVAIGTYNFVRVAVEKQKFFKMSVTDGLTGLYNIRYFKLLLETEIRLMKHDPARKFCIVMSDVDHFKHFNDTYGHQVGDLVLKEVAAALKETVRTADIVARYGGEEMIVLLRGADLKDALSIAEKLRKNIENRQLKDEKNTYRVTASLGVSVYRPGDDADTVIKRADDGLYKAKESGRNRVSTIEGP
jgi:diguanylate cyclase (GGDEF)-like protein